MQLSPTPLDLCLSFLPVFFTIRPKSSCYDDCRGRRARLDNQLAVPGENFCCQVVQLVRSKFARVFELLLLLAEEPVVLLGCQVYFSLLLPSRAKYNII